MFLPLGQRGHASANQPIVNHRRPNYHIILSKHKIVRKHDVFEQSTMFWYSGMQTRCFQKGMKILQVLEAHGIYKLTSCMYHFATSNLVLASWNSMLRWRQRQQSEFEPPSEETLEVCTIFCIFLSMWAKDGEAQRECLAHQYGMDWWCFRRRPPHELEGPG